MSGACHQAVKALRAARQLVLFALATGCVETERVPIGGSGPRAAAETAPAPAPGATSAQPRTDSDEPAAPARTPEVATDAPGATESQPKGRLRAAQLVQRASQQMDRLRLMETSGNDGVLREDIDDALGGLASQREKVLQDLAEFELRPSDDLLVKVDEDVASLDGAVKRSYTVAPPPSQGLPQPSPLAPSLAW